MNTLVLTVVVLAAVVVIASGAWVGAALVRCLHTREPSSDTDASGNDEAGN